MTRWDLIADAVVVLHAAYVAFVVFGLVAIFIGAALGARWVRNFWFRTIHLASIGLVLAEIMVNVACPLTSLEKALRERAGQPFYAGDFIAYWMHRLIFYDWPSWVFATLYVGVTLVVAAMYLLIPPEPRRSRTRR